MSVQQVHSRLGHMSEEVTRQRNLQKDTGSQIASLVASRVNWHCCSFKACLTMKVASVWRLLVFYPSQLKITDIFNAKSVMIEPTSEKLNQTCQLGVGPKFRLIENAGEIKPLAGRLKSKDWTRPITVEWTTRDSPQQNSPAEVGFATLAGRARATMVATKNMRKARARSSQDCTVDPPCAKTLRTWREAGTVTIKSRTFQPKGAVRYDRIHLLFQRKLAHEGVWRLMVFFPSQLKITDIFNAKSAMIEPTIEKLNQTCQLGVGPTFLRMDNARD
jgi:hypothetical protein